MKEIGRRGHISEASIKSTSGIWGLRHQPKLFSSPEHWKIQGVGKRRTKQSAQNKERNVGIQSVQK